MCGPQPEAFRPDTKCCTVHPVLPNFLVGEILRDRTAEGQGGRLRMMARLEQRVGVTPHGVLAPRTTDLLYRHSGHVFGRHSAIVCPYLDRSEGSCTIWRHRNATCATWHCKHERGALGYAHWRMLHAVLTVIERDLATWCLVDSTLPMTAIAEALPPLIMDSGEARLAAGDLDAIVSDAAWQRLWGSVGASPSDWYIDCAERVAALSWEDVLRHCGPEIRGRAALVKEAAQDLERALPERLVAGTCQVSAVDAATVQLTTYSPHDPLALPADIISFLARFDGRPYTEVVAEMREDGVELDENVLRTLFDFRALVARP